MWFKKEFKCNYCDCSITKGDLREIRAMKYANMYFCSYNCFNKFIEKVELNKLLELDLKDRTSYNK